MSKVPLNLEFTHVPFWNVMAWVLSTKIVRGHLTAIPISSHRQLNSRPHFTASANGSYFGEITMVMRWLASNMHSEPRGNKTKQGKMFYNVFKGI